METNNIPGTTGTSAPLQIPIHHFKKKNKNRLLPPVFYPRWELELLFSAGAILLLLVLGYTVFNNNGSSSHGAAGNIHWLSLASIILIIGFALNIIFRAYWLALVLKGRNKLLPDGVDFPEEISPEKSKEKITAMRHLAMEIDKWAEDIFFVSAMLLVAIAVLFIIQMIAAFVINDISGRANNIQQLQPQ